MLNSYRAVIEKGHIKWLDTPPLVTSANVIITILSAVEQDTPVKTQTVKQERKLGFMVR